MCGCVCLGGGVKGCLLLTPPAAAGALQPPPQSPNRFESLLPTRFPSQLAADVDLLQLARDLPGLVGADLANIVNEAQLNGEPHALTCCCALSPNLLPQPPRQAAAPAKATCSLKQRQPPTADRLLPRSPQPCAAAAPS